MYNIYFYKYKHDDNYRVYIIPNHYSHSVDYILKTIEFAKTIAAVPTMENINIEVLAGSRYSRMISVEFTSETMPTQGMELTDDSGIWEWLKY